jgi:predicted dehydrogenase
MMSVRKGAIVGFGNVAANGHLPGWRERSDFRIVAVTDCDPQRRALAERLIPGVRTYASSDELLRNERLDFVDVATPPAYHTEAILAAADAGVHVICEKPLTTSLREYSILRAAVQRAGIVLYTVDNWKYSEAFRVVREIVAQGALGPLNAIAFDTERNGCSAATRDNWRVRASIAGGGILVDHGWHAFYLLLALANERPERISASLERRRYIDAEVEDTALCAVDFPSVTAEIRLTWAAPARHTSWRLVGDDGQLVIDDDQLVLQGRSTQRSQRLATALSAGSHHPEWFGGVIDAFRRELDDPSVQGANQAEAEWCLLMLNLAYASDAQDSRPLAVPRRSEWFEGSVAQP